MGNLRNNKLTIITVITNLILFLLLFPTQGLTWIILSMLFWISLIFTIGLFLVKKSNTLIDKKLERGLINLSQCVYDKKTMKVLIIILTIIFGFCGYIIYAAFIPNFKGAINEGYLQEIVNEITEDKITDYDKIGAVLNWFDQKNDNLYNSWFLTHSGKPYFNLPGTYMIFLLEPPYICIRCFENSDIKWLLTSRCGACGEYSRLFMIMVDALGYDVRRIHAPGEDHLWNEVKIDNNWIPVDPTNVSLPEADGWENFGFFEHKEGNASYIWAEYLHNNTIEDLTSHYTDLTNITIYCVDEFNNSASEATITIVSHNLKREPDHETFIKNKPKPITNESGYCTFQIGGGNYTFRANSDKFYGELKWVEFSDSILNYGFTIKLKEK